MKLLVFIATNFSGNQAAFARHMGVNRQQVTKWINDNWVVIDNTLYSPKRDIPVTDDETR